MINIRTFFATFLLFTAATAYSSGETIKVGILHSLTGTMAISERGVVDALELGIKEINDAGGLLGKKIEAVKYDGASDWDEFAKGANELIEKHQVVSIFGCWTSASRKRVLPVVERKNHLLWYPVQYEGMEQSPNIIYTGAAPNQQIIPAARWAVSEGKLGNKVFLVGSDYIFPRTANKIVKKFLKQPEFNHVKVVGEAYRNLGDKDFKGIVDKIVKINPSFIISTINGDSNVWFFKRLQASKARNIPVISMSIAEPELVEIGRQIGGVSHLKGHFAVWNYFQSYKSTRNDLFISSFKKKYGSSRTLSDPQEAAYFQIHLFAKAIKKAGSTDVHAIRKAVKGLEINAPSGVLKIDETNNHTHKRVLVGKINLEGQFDIVWDSEKLVAPEPFPAFMK